MQVSGLARAVWEAVSALGVLAFQPSFHHGKNPSNNNRKKKKQIMTVITTDSGKTQPESVHRFLFDIPRI